MALELTTNTVRALSDLSLKPVIAMTIEGLPYIFSTTEVSEYIKIGDDGLFINNINGDEWFIGGLKAIDNNLTYLDDSSSNFTIRQQMNQDTASSSSASSMSMSFVDKEEFITRIISPGFELEDILGAQASIYVGFADNSFFEDYNVVFRGEITEVDSGAGNIKFKIDHSDAKKLTEIFLEADTALAENIDGAQSSFLVENGSSILQPLPYTNPDVNVQYTPYMKIDDEFMEIVSVVGETVTVTNRGSLGSAAVAHALDAGITVVHRIFGNPLEIAMAIMASGREGDPSIEDVAVTSIVNVGLGTNTVDNAIYFSALNLPRDIGAVIGDFITITGATNGANNFVRRKITDIQFEDLGYYVVVDGAPLVLEGSTSAVAGFSSKYDILPAGLNFRTNEIDVARHEEYVQLFFSATAMEFFIEEAIDGREFIDEQLYKPIACYSVPRKAASSVGYSIGPYPGTSIKTLDDTNVKNPDSTLKIKRSINKAYFNEVVYRYEQSLQDKDRYLAGLVVDSQTSKNRITRKSKQFLVSANGLRRTLDGEGIAQSQAQRIIDRYQFAAEEVPISLLMRDGFEIEIGDVVIGDFSALSVSDISQGNRDFQTRMFEVLSISKNFKTGGVEAVLLDTGFGPETRYGLMSPCSQVGNVLGPTQFTIERFPQYGSIFGDDEWRFWEGIANITEDACIRFTDPNTFVNENAKLLSVNEATFTIENPLSVLTLSSGLIVEYCEYTDSEVSDKQKLIWGWMTDDPNFPDGSEPYTML